MLQTRQYGIYMYYSQVYVKVVLPAFNTGIP